MSLTETVPYLRWRTTQLAQFELTYAVNVGKVTMVFVAVVAKSDRSMEPVVTRTVAALSIKVVQSSALRES